MENWRKVWREGFAPLISIEGLEALKSALSNDDPRLLQGATTTPPSFQCIQHWNVVAACAIGFCGWQGGGLQTVEQVHAYFARICYEADQRLSEPAAHRWFLNWFDETPREEMRELLLEEVKLVVKKMKTEAA